MNDKVEVKGISQFFHYAIPAVLALAAIWWLAFGKDLHSFRRELSQEDRHAEIVGAKPLPKEPIQFDVRNERSECVKIDRAEVDGGDLWLYYHNDCHEKRSYIKFSWSSKSPDGTIVAGGERYSELGRNGGPSALYDSEKAEFRDDLNDDPRGKTLIVRVHSENY